MFKCFVIGCENNTTRENVNCKYYRFPKYPCIREKLLKACGNPMRVEVKNGRCNLIFNECRTKSLLLKVSKSK